MSDKNCVLVVTDSSPGKLSDSLRGALTQLDYDQCICRPDEALGQLKTNVDIRLAVLSLEDFEQSDKYGPEISKLTKALKDMAINLLVITHDIETAGKSPSILSDGAFRADGFESADMITGRLAMLGDMQEHLKHLTGEINRLHALGQPLNSHFQQVNEEMQMAARLQRDFLPKQMPDLPGFQFSTIYRPATWVSGDIYDIMRLDEDHIGMYVADAVGHGMPAALLTMFIKRSIVTKKIFKNSYELIDPGEVLRQLNEDMVGQGLSDFQFATCCYGILNFKTLELRLASGGHPMPIRFDKNLEMFELESSGALLGVFGDQVYKTQTHQLECGDKILMFSDGVELAFENEGPDKPMKFRKEFEDLAHYDIESMSNRLLEIIEKEEGSLHPRDDVTILGVEISPS
ncbi:MAG: serine/threonine-protein phosphatase [Phycisphaerae bacterium]|nr:serine/threonine-protein phosphatase [Phycisphaerae bacterium]